MKPALKASVSGGQDGRAQASGLPERRPPNSDLCVGRVLAASAGVFEVSVADEDVSAVRAFGCLVEPAVGDRVLLARTGDETFVLSVLDRLVGDSASLSVPGASALTLAAGDLTLEATRRLVAAGGEEAVLRGARVGIHARTLSIAGRMMSLVMDHLRSVVRRSETTADTLAVHAGERTSVVRGADVSRVGTLVQEVETVSSNSAEIAVIVAREDVRVDAKRVTVG